MRRTFATLAMSLLAVACVHSGDKPPQTPTSSIGCTSKAALNEWEHASQEKRSALTKSGACFLISDSWQLVQSDERSPEFSVVDFIDPATGKTIKVWTRDHYGDD